MRRISRCSITIALLISLGSLVGCADMVTFSKDSHERGMGLYNQQQYADAAGSFRNAVKQNPRDYGSYYMLGCCYEQMGQHQQAINSLRTSLDVQNICYEAKDDDDQRLKTINALGVAIARSDTRDIETNAAVSKANSSQRADDYMLLGQIYANRGDADSAVEAMDHASLLAPDKFYIAKAYGLYLEKLGQKQRAEAALRRAYVIKQNDEQVNLALRRVGVVPGPSIKRQEDLVHPPLPHGPLPELDLSWMGQNKATTTTPPPPSASPAPRAKSSGSPSGATAATPRD